MLSWAAGWTVSCCATFMERMLWAIASPLARWTRYRLAAKGPQTADSLRTTTCAATSDSALLPACQRHLATLLLSHPGCNLPCPPLWEQWTTPPDGSIRSSRPQCATCRTKARSNFKRRQCSWLTRTMAFAAGAEVDTGSGAQLLGAMVLSCKCHIVCGWRLWHEGA